MPVEDADDRAAFVDPDEFGTAVTYTPLNGAPVDIMGLLMQSPVMSVLGSGGPSHNGTALRLLLRTDDVPSPAEGDSALIDGTTYQVVPPIAPDGTGMVAVFLEATP